MKGENTITVAEKIGFGSQDYNLINVDGEGETTQNNNNNNNNNQNEEEEPFDSNNGKSLRGNIISKFLIAMIILFL